MGQEDLERFNRGKSAFKNENRILKKGEIGKVADNQIKKDFYTANPFEKLTTHVTEFKVCGKKVYLFPIMDLFHFKMS